MTDKRSVTIVLIGLFAALLVADTLVLVFEKMGATSAGIPQTGAGDFLTKVVQIPWTWLAIAINPVQLFLWTKILDRCDLSVAYPVSSLCFPVTMIAASIFFAEHVSFVGWVGAVLITAGVAIVGSDTKAEEEKP